MRYGKGFLVLVSLLGVIAAPGVGAVAGSGATGSSAPAASRFPGRLLAVTNYPTTVVEFASGSKEWKRVGRAPVAFAASTSPDGRYVVTQGGTLAAVGAKDRVKLPEGGPRSGYDVAFSPDGTRLAYATSRSNKPEGVVLYDLATGAHQVLVGTECQDYTYLYSGGAACGDVEDVVWIDDQTLLVSRFAGELPSAADCYGKVPGIVDYCDDFSANTYSVVTTTGAITANMPAALDEAGDTVGLAQTRGVTTLLDDDRWIDVNAIRSGVGTPNAAPPGNPLPCLSADGARVVVAGRRWKVVELRTGVETPLGTRPKEVDADESSCVWSPDDSFVAVQDRLTQYGDGNSPGPIWVAPTAAGRGTSLPYVLGSLVSWVAEV